MHPASAPAEIRAAVAARHDRETFILARTDARVGVPSRGGTIREVRTRAAPLVGSHWGGMPVRPPAPTQAAGGSVTRGSTWP